MIAFAIASISSIISTLSMPYDLGFDKGPEKIKMKKRIVHILLWLLFAYIIVSAGLELMKGMGY